MMAASSAAVGQETRNAFVWIELTPPTSGDFENWQVVQSVKDINNQGRIIGQVSQGGSSTRGFIITNGQWTMLKPNDVATIVREINGESKVVGWTSTATGRGWSPEYTQNGAELGSGIRVEGINDSNHYVGYDVNQSTPVGWLTAAEGWVALPPLNEGDATAAHGISHGDQSNYPLIVGRSIDDEQAATFPVAWTYDGQDFTAHALDPGLADETDLPFTVNNSGWIVGATNASSPYGYLLWVPDGEDSWARIDLELSGATQSGIDLNASNEIVAKDTLFVLDDQAALTALELYDLVNLPTSSSEATRWYDTTATTFLTINDHGWIAGKARRKESGQSDVDVVLLLVPYDLNNNGEPDYREIMADPTLDEDNGNWIIDWAEQMRSGLHAPGHPEDDSTGEIENVQIVRQRVNVKQRDGVGLGEGEGLIYIDEVLSPAENCTACQNFTDLLNQWGTGSHNPSDPNQSETIVWVRSLLEEDITGWGDHDALPANADDRAEALEDIRTFAYRFAHCIDWLQWGNEVFGGAGGYKFRNSDLSCTITDGTEFESLPEECKQEAADKVLEWIEAQMLAAREGSAMAGRPIRMIGPGIPSDPVRGGYDNEGPGRYITTETINLCNRHNMYFSMHVHYQTVALAEESIKKLVDTWETPPAAPWDVPEFKVATEWGPMADFPNPPNHQGDTWWTSGTPFTNQVIYQRFFFGSTDPGESWDSFVGRWEDDSQSFGDETQEFPGFRFDDVLDYFDVAGFTAVCYGPSLQHSPGDNPNIPDAFNVAGLCTNHVRPVLEEPYFSSLRTRYQNAVSNGGFVITPFDPHEEAVSTSETCPDCQ